jgi:hypothetical protein
MYASELDTLWMPHLSLHVVAWARPAFWGGVPEGDTIPWVELGLNVPLRELGLPIARGIPTRHLHATVVAVHTAGYIALCIVAWVEAAPVLRMGLHACHTQHSLNACSAFTCTDV